MKIKLFSPFEWYLGGGERYLMKMAEVLARNPDHEVTIVGSQPFAGSQYERIVGLPARVSFEYRPELASARRRYILPKNNLDCDLFITLSNRFYPPIRAVGKYNWTVLQFPMPSSGYKKLVAIVLGYLFSSRYQNVICYSEFTASWVKKRALPFLKPKVNIVSPPILNAYYQDEAASRQNWILTVGRFFVGGHNKKQLEMVAAFRQMVDAGLQGWQLHVAGTTRTEPENQAYLQRVQALAKDYPIFFHLNSPETELLSLYRTARIFWHATGLGKDNLKEPENMEHFGMTTAEAMASGLVPIVIAQGGQLEIVSQGVNGFKWQNVEEMIKYTQQLIEQPALWQKLSTAARQNSQKYSEDEFALQIQQLVQKLGNYSSNL